MTSPAALGIAVGFARRDITPALGTPAMYGVTCFVDEIWDPLHVTALVLDDGAERVAIVGADVAAFLERNYREIAEAVAAALGVSCERVLLNASHTHSGPYLSTELQALLDPYDVKAVDYAYADRVREAIVAAVREAAYAVQPAAALVGRGRVERVGANRRVELPDGRTIHRYARPPEEYRRLPEGLVDPEATVVRFDDSTGTPLGALVNYACHPTAAGGDLHGWVSADFVGHGLRRVEAILGAPCLFLQGTAGDVGTGKWNAGTAREDVRAMGERFADGVLEALGTVEPVVGSSVRVRHERVELTLEPFPPLRDLERRLEAAVAGGIAGDIVAVGDAMVVARRADELRRARIGAVGLGDLAISSLPAEVFVALGLEIKRRSPFRRTLVCAYTDNSLQYIPTAEAFAGGEFEIDGGWRYVEAGAGERLVESAVRTLDSLYGAHAS